MTPPPPPPVQYTLPSHGLVSDKAAGLPGPRAAMLQEGWAGPSTPANLQKMRGNFRCHIPFRGLARPESAPTGEHRGPPSRVAMQAIMGTPQSSIGDARPQSSIGMSRPRRLSVPPRVSSALNMPTCFDHVYISHGLAPCVAHTYASHISSCPDDHDSGVSWTSHGTNPELAVPADPSSNSPQIMPREP